MSSEKDPLLEKILKTVDKIADEVSSLKTSIKDISSIPKISDNIESLYKSVKDVKETVSPVSAIEGLAKGKDIDILLKKVEGITKSIAEVTKELKDVKASADTSAVTDRIDGVLKAIKSISSTLKEIEGSTDNEEISTKIDESLTSITALHSAIKALSESDDTDLILKKIDDLQQYVASLSGLEDKITDLSQSFEETKEIVSIIVRQLDDLERKYNKALEEINTAVDSITKVVKELPSASPETISEAAPAKTKPVVTTPAADLDAMPSTIDELMDSLLAMVSSRTEAIKMAEALERVRDKLTTLITETTPVLFQFGKRARELKSYPPTATLNENDITRLHKEIREWKKKLKEISDS